MVVLLVTLMLCLTSSLLKTYVETEDTSKITIDPLRRSDILRQQVTDACKNLSMSTNSVYKTLQHMHYDDKRKVIYCYIPKVACTSWKRVFLKMTGKIKPDEDENTLDRYAVHTRLPLLASDKNKTEKLRTYKKFMFVRHPFERVLAAYRDKLEGSDSHSSYNFHFEVGRKIEKKYRGTIEAEGHNVTFSEFIRFISEPGRGTPEQQNEHWLPMHELCNPCAVQYDFIGKYENLKEDADYLLKWIGPTEVMDKFPVSDRPTNSSHYVSKYYGQLSHSEIKAFYIKYMPDFLLFNYE